MSTLKATQADGYYHPPEYNARKHGSISRFHGSRGHNQAMKRGINRIELPHKALCKSCEKVLDQGTRFNAKKRIIGMYFTTEIYSFDFCCPACSAPLQMTTDPKNRDYAYQMNLKLFNANLYEQRKLGLNVLSSEEHSKDLEALDSLVDKEVRLHRSRTQVQRLIEVNKELRKDDVSSNRLLRKLNREAKKKENALRAAARRLKVNFVLEDEKEIQCKQDEIIFIRKRKLNIEKDPRSLVKEIYVSKRGKKSSMHQFCFHKKKNLLQGNYDSDSD